MLSTDLKILDILMEEQKTNPLLQDFHIDHPSNRVAEESNSIFVAVVSSEPNNSGFEFQDFTDLVEILIVTKQVEYEEAITIIKTVSKLICGLLLKHQDEFPNKPVIRNINPEFNRDFVLTRGHIMVQVKTAPIDFEVTDEEYKVCSIILNGNVIEE